MHVRNLITQIIIIVMKKRIFYNLYTCNIFYCLFNSLTITVTITMYVIPLYALMICIKTVNDF